MNTLGYLRVMFTVDDIDETLERLQKRGARLVGEVVQYLDVYRLCYIRGPEDVLIGLAEESALLPCKVTHPRCPGRARIDAHPLKLRQYGFPCVRIPFHAPLQQ